MQNRVSTLPYQIAGGDLSDHLDSLSLVFEKTAILCKIQRCRISSGSEFEPIYGCSRAICEGNRVIVGGTTATHEERIIGVIDLRAQTVYILDKIAASLASLGATMNDVIRTRIYLKDATQWEVVSRVHGRYFAECLPAHTLIEVSNLVGDYEVGIEVEAVVD